MTATTETIPGTDQIDRTDQNRPAGEAADVGPVSAPSPGEDRWDQEDAGLYGPRGWSVEAGVWHELARCRDDLRSTVIPAEYGHGPEGLIAADGTPQDDYTPFHDLGPRPQDSALFVSAIPRGGSVHGIARQICAAERNHSRLQNDRQWRVRPSA